MSADASDRALRAAREAYRARDGGRAAELCEQGLRDAPDHAALLHLRALVHLQAGEFEPASRRAKEALVRDAGQAPFHLTLGYACRALGQWDEAERHYRDALALNPAYYEALLNLGALLGHQQRLDEARACYERAAGARPELPHAHYNLGRLCQEREQLEQAEGHYERALAADPAHAPSSMNLGDVAQQRGDLAQAVARYRRALELDPGYAAAHNNLATALQHLGLVDEAIGHYRAALELDPRYVEALQNLGAALVDRGARDEARGCYEQVLALDPGHAEAGFALAALRGENPEQPPPEHVRSLFDDYAARFDAHLQSQLGYHVPELLAQRVRVLCGTEARLEVLDLGCGTGLFGAAVAPLALAVDGVDLSRRMLERAQARGVYRALHDADIATFLAGARAGGYDLVAATDVFIYVGALERVFAEVARVLRPAGLFAFSVEAPDDVPAAGYRLQPTGRYAHAERYLRELAAEHGFEPRLCETLTLRNQGGRPVPGQMWICSKSA